MLLNLTVTPDLVQQAYNALLDAICFGELTAGSRVTQEQAAEKLAISRQPVLQAFARLKREGFLVDAGRKGVQVSALDPGQLTQLYQIRGELDALAAGLAAQRVASGAVPVPDDALLRAGRQTEAQSATQSARQFAMQAESLRDIVAADIGFHTTLYRLSGNPLIETTLALHWQHLRRVMGAVLQEQGARRGIWDEHARIWRAVQQGDALLAAQLARKHTAQAADALSARLQTALAQQAAPASMPLRTPAQARTQARDPAHDLAHDLAHDPALATAHKG